MNLIVLPAAQKALQKMPKHDAMALMDKIEAFAADPFVPHGFAKRLAGTAATRVRHGDWRAICTVDGALMTVTVIKAGNRRDIYE